MSQSAKLRASARTLLLAIPVAALALLACEGGEGGAEGGAEGRPEIGATDVSHAAPAVRPNVVLIVIDTLRADRLPFYGGPDYTAPYLTSLAERGLVFDNAWAASSWTAPATASIFTGLYPNEHGVQYNLFSQMRKRKALGVFMHQSLPAEVETLPLLMKRLGYRTFAVIDNPNVSRMNGLQRGFDHFVGRRELAGSGAELIAKQVIAWKEDLAGDDPFFLYLHFMDPHWPYRSHAEWQFDSAEPPAEPILDLGLYDAEIRHADENIRAIFEEIGLDERTLVVVTSDHGQEFLDHGGKGHGFQLYAELTRVPLLIHQPGNKQLRGRVTRNVGHVDLLPTLRDLLGDPTLATAPGRSVLAPEAGRESHPHEAHAMRSGILGSRVMSLHAVVRGRYKLILAQPGMATSLYDLAVDPTEQRDLSHEHPELVAELVSLVDRQVAVAAAREPSEPDGEPLPQPSAELLEELEALGYAEGGPNEGIPPGDSTPSGGLSE